MSSPLDRRRAGMLLHPTSLPGPQANGDLGPDARCFVDFLTECGFSVWQTLPLGPTHGDLSPYGCLSAHAGNEYLISLDLLTEWGWLGPEEEGEGESDRPGRARSLALARRGFQAAATEEDRGTYRRFVRRHGWWLDDYALYRALRTAYPGLPWWRWPAELRDRDPKALHRAGRRLHAEVEQARFEQFVFNRQWCGLKEYANRNGVLIFGDMPLFVAQDSADVWAQPQYFRLGEDARPEVVAGVPPDYFSETGQRWGNPHYDWERMREDGFRWWVERIGSVLELFDLVRIDHFRGLEAYWEIDAAEETAMHGRWVKAPGDALLGTLAETYDRLPLVAEDLGIITEEVTRLRDRFDLPGMKILQFAFGGDASNPYLPHNLEPNAVVYTGTHDNNTTLGWFRGLDAAVRQHVIDYLACSEDAMPTALCRTAFASVSRLAVIPMQDLLRLGGAHRMNTPGSGVEGGNWRWRFTWEQLDNATPSQYRRLLDMYGRLA